jgi:Fic family protein
VEIIDFIMENKEYLKDFITRSTYHSNAIEGSTLTYAETYAILFNDNNFKINNKEPREIYEAINHKKAMLILFDRLKKDELNLDEHFIKQINETINQDIKDTKGYRNVRVMIRGSEHIPPNPEQINNLMMYFVYNYNHDENTDIFYKIANYHLEFERIHPFEDGNGRTGRLLINFELLKNNIPPIVIPKEGRTEYFEFLRNKDVEGFANFLRTLSKKEKERIEFFKS